MNEVAKHVIITGKVQGVWYRDWTVSTANSLKLRGWVRNLREGSVEALFIGPHDKVEAMIHACHDGPPNANVSDIHTEEAEDDGSIGFARKSTV